MTRHRTESNRCVEVAGAGRRVGVRDSENPGQALAVTRRAWGRFARHSKRGTFDGR